MLCVCVQFINTAEWLVDTLAQASGAELSELVQKYQTSRFSTDMKAELTTAKQREAKYKQQSRYAQGQ